MLNEHDKAIFDLFCHKIRERLPDTRIYAYGSRVRGDHQEDSDLDVCVVVPEYTHEIRKFISHTAWEVGFDHDLLIQTVVFSIEEFDHFPGDANPLVQAILEEGIAA